MLWNKFHIHINQQIAHYLSYNKVLDFLSLVEHNKKHLKEFFHKHNQTVLPNYSWLNGRSWLTVAQGNPTTDDLVFHALLRQKYLTIT